MNSVSENEKAWWSRHDARKREADTPPYRCPCCLYRVLNECGSDIICSICFWEDDGQDDIDADEIRGGPNGSLSLSVARANFVNFGASESSFLKSVRQPRPEER